ncbi:hypothetical protein TWF106_005586 [Orbilia oligospora]|uniref:Splicing factor YJU2 n=1 Tax=Orbilia oligospora TaxID=2813651 RepID=A0A6G1M3B7_ORBOL|nr:hypothetical protein TWF788_002235 [Orbilia oligospora]KAF3195481.1 hypothetical protein TWF106_005586 [Orbilia oligospora]KAF3199121.1 hypothetical protein TWF191_004607 [Orbilia oligospora]KAF3201335.1 hypothetical protein TWF679_011395 [Orbilia oligospora]KAF3242832.1 hypothetical protein TWF192_008547 [Orbilia oligospora]
MSERKVLTKWYPPDFDPSKIKRSKAPKQAGPKSQTVRLMAPFGMRCTSCGEYIYKGRKFNARKEHTDEKYYAISIYRFYIRCTRCSSEIVFKTDPKNMDYECEKGAVRNFEPWRDQKAIEETEEERLNRLEEQIQVEEDENAMARLETKTLDSKREMAIADALDEIRTRNARVERADGGAVLDALMTIKESRDEEAERLDREDDEAARKAFQTSDGEHVRRIVDEEVTGSSSSSSNQSKGLITFSEEKDSVAVATAEIPSFKRQVKKKKDLAGALGLKKKPKLGLV